VDFGCGAAAEASSVSTAGTRRLRRVALVLVAIGLFVESVYPFRFDPPRWRENEVARTPEGGLRFGGYNVARTRGAPPFLPAMESGAPVRVELEVRSARADQRGPARIFTVERDYWNAVLVVGQDGADLVVSVDRLTRGAARKLRAAGVFDVPGWHDVTVRLDARRIEVAVDGRTRDAAELSGDRAPRPAGMRLALGDAPLGNRPWRGTIRVAQVAADGREFDCLRDGSLAIPRRALFVPERLRRMRRYLIHDDPFVFGLHLASFVPLGVLVALGARRRREIAAALGSAFLLGVVLQLAKVAFAARHPCLLDVAAQLAGACIGAGIVVAWRGSARSPAR
jgi:hypothetical protein